MADAEKTNLLLEEYTTLVSAQKKYCGDPVPEFNTSRTDFRADITIDNIAADLLRENGTVSILDVCCGEGVLAVHLESLSAHLAMIDYVGIDVNDHSIQRAKQHTDHLKPQFHSLQLIVRDAADLGGVSSKGGFDLIVMANCLHEIPPRYYGDILTKLNKKLKGSGNILLMDMERLPDDEPECGAIVWTCREIACLLEAAGLKVVSSRHPKTKSDAYAVRIGRAEKVDTKALDRKIVELLQRKLDATIDERRKLSPTFYLRFDEIMKWMVLTGTIARLSEELTHYRRKTERVKTRNQRPKT